MSLDPGHDRSLRPAGGGSDPSTEVLRVPSSVASPDPSREACTVASDGAGADSSTCSWCRGPMPARSATARARRRDAETCSKRCRQARHRFKIERAGEVAADRPMSFAYADPPYPGMAWRYYRGEEVDHPALIRRLLEEFPDGWAMSTSSDALPRVLRMIPEDAIPDIRVASWTKSARPNKRARRPTSTWEPVIVYRGRPLPAGHNVRDALVWGGRPLPVRRDPRRPGRLRAGRAPVPPRRPRSARLPPRPRSPRSDPDLVARSTLTRRRSTPATPRKDHRCPAR